MLRLKIEKESKLKEKDMIIEVSQSKSDMHKVRMIKDRKQRLEVNQHVRNTKVLKLKMNEFLKHASEIEMDNNLLEQSNNANAKNNHKFKEQVSKQEN